MALSDQAPIGTNVGFIRLQKTQSASRVQIVDFSRFEESKHSVRFREENWIVLKAGAPKQSSPGRNTGEFTYSVWADEHFAWWLKSKLESGYTILQVNGSPGPLPQNI